MHLTSYHHLLFAHQEYDISPQKHLHNCHTLSRRWRSPTDREIVSVDVPQLTWSLVCHGHLSSDDGASQNFMSNYLDLHNVIDSRIISHNDLHCINVIVVGSRAGSPAAHMSLRACSNPPAPRPGAASGKRRSTSAAPRCASGARPPCPGQLAAGAHGLRIARGATVARYGLTDGLQGG
jgi:hypothetical protein